MNITDIKLKLIKYIDSLDEDSLVKVYDYFVKEIDANDQSINKEIKEELDFRYNHFEKNYSDYQNWEEIKEKYGK
jgi:hypothetical protein